LNCEHGESDNVLVALRHDLHRWACCVGQDYRISVLAQPSFPELLAQRAGPAAAGGAGVVAGGIDLVPVPQLPAEGGVVALAHETA